MKDRLFSDKLFYQKLVKLAVPIVIQSVMLALVAVADTIMLGNVEQNSMSAVSLASQIQFIQNIILSAIVVSCSILGAQYWGKKDLDTLNDIFCMGLRLASIVSIFCFIVCTVFPNVLMCIFTNDPTLIDLGSRYLRLAGWSYLLTGISQCYLVIMKVSDHAAQPARISSLTVIINIILNAFFIFGLFGIPAMGVQGAALATLISRIVELILSVITSYRPGYIHPNFKYLFKRDRQLAKDFSKCALPLLGANLFWGIGFTSYTAFMGHLGADATAANSVTVVVRDLVCCACEGVATAGGIMVGNELGAGNLKQGKCYGDRLVKLSFLLGVVCMLILMAVTPLVIHFVKLTDQATKYLIGMMFIMAVYMIGRAVNSVTINGIFAAGGDTIFDMYSLAVCMWCIAIPLAIAGTFFLHWPVLIIYACTCLDEVGKIPWVMIHYKKYIWVKDLTREIDHT